MIRAFIVDDEIKSIQNLQILLEAHAAEITVLGTASGAMEAMKKILDIKPDLLFLDIRMPGINGLELLDQVEDHCPYIVFITAHKDYAIEALRKGAFDYLLKPFDEEELKNCIERIKTDQSQASFNAQGTGVIELSVKSGIIYVRQEDIVFLEASGSYTEFHLENKVRHLVSKNMKTFEALLNPSLFFRCHNSYIVNLTKVSQFINTDGFFVELTSGDRVSVSRRNKEDFLEKLKGN